MVLIIIIGLGVAWLVWWLVRHQRQLKQRAQLMQEAIRNRDFTFRLPTNGLLPGERAMQQALNQLGDTIRQQLNQREVESWERLTRVLTHEIMNATAPIASISQSLLGRSDVRDTPLEEGVQAIHNAASHLGTFVDSYRKLSSLQQPNMEPVDVQTILNEVNGLFPQLGKQMDTAGAGRVYGDRSMLCHVLTNLYKNALEAGASTVMIKADGPCLYVGNDGRPITAADRQSIFVPFFTTKRSGQGVGLSLSRRMMVAQGGMIELAEKAMPGCHVVFVLTLSLRL